MMSERLPEGPWLLVAGCHRSGTSAMAGALVALGLQGVAEGDRMTWTESNPEHWESLSLTVLNDQVLESEGGSWDAPPSRAALSALEGIPAMPPSVAHCAKVAFPEPDPLAWKDPRLCVLLPLWRRVLPAPLAVVFIWRQPLEVARSLEQRDDMPVATGLALWDRYCRSALMDLQGLDVFVVEHADLLEGPSEVLGAVAEWLSSLPPFQERREGWHVDEAASTIDEALYRQRQRAEGERSALPQEQRELVDRLVALAGPHRGFDPGGVGPAPIWADELVKVRRDARRTVDALERQLDRERREADEQLARERAAFEGERAAAAHELAETRREFEGALQRCQDELEGTKRVLQHLMASTSWRITKPLCTLLGHRASAPASALGAAHNSAPGATQGSAPDATRGPAPGASSDPTSDSSRP